MKSQNYNSVQLGSQRVSTGWVLTHLQGSQSAKVILPPFETQVYYFRRSDSDLGDMYSWGDGCPGLEVQFLRQWVGIVDGRPFWRTTPG